MHFMTAFLRITSSTWVCVAICAGTVATFTQSLAIWRETVATFPITVAIQILGS